MDREDSRPDEEVTVDKLKKKKRKADRFRKGKGEERMKWTVAYRVPKPRGRHKTPGNQQWTVPFDG